jgi:hypothetical protein
MPGSVRALARLDRLLTSVPAPARAAIYVVTALVMAAMALPHVPGAYVDFRRVPLLGHVQQRHETYGTDTIADMYVARVVLNDPFDMYTKAKVEQTPLEAATWTKEASSPYPPAVLLAEAALYAAANRLGIGFYGAVSLLAIAFLAGSAAYFSRTRWYLFPALYLNFSYFGERFFHVQDGSYLVMLGVLLWALFLARRGRAACHALVALAIAMKLSSLYYLVNLGRMRRRDAWLFVAILAAGLVLPWLVFENYLYIFEYGAELKGDWDNLAAALLFVMPFTLVLRYVETKLAFDWEDRIGWGAVPFALLLALKMNAARHLLIVLLIPDKRAARNLSAAAGLAVPALLPLPFNSSLAIAVTGLVAALAYYLWRIGWEELRRDLRHPRRTLHALFSASVRTPHS